MEKIIRTICIFSDQVSNKEIEKLEKISQLLQEKGFLIQTKRICLSDYKTQTSDTELLNKGILLGLGEQTFERIKENFAMSIKKYLYRLST